MKKLTFAILALLSFSSFANAIKDSDNAFACLAHNPATGEKAILSWTNVEYDKTFLQKVGADEKRVLMDKSAFNIASMSNTGTSLNFSLTAEYEILARGTFTIDKQTGKGTLSKSLTSSGWDDQRYWLFPLTNFTCRSTKTNTNTFKPNSFLRSLGLPAIDSSRRYTRVGCSEFDNFCGTVKID